jgi:hypothetical protein
VIGAYHNAFKITNRSHRIMLDIIYITISGRVFGETH